MRILLIRTSALGDIVHCLPVLRALRENLPDATIGWIVEGSMAPLIADHPDLDQVLPVRLRVWRKKLLQAKTWRELRHAWREIRGFRADIALDLMGNHKAGFLAWMSGAKRTIGLAKRHRREPSSAFWLREGVTAVGDHAVDHAMSVLQALDLPTEPVDFGPDRLLPGAQASENSALDLGSEPFALIHPGTGWGSKTYPAERWASVARQLAQRSGLRVGVALSHDAAERRLAQQIVDQARDRGAGSRVLPIECDELSSLVAVSRQARIVLGGDTGPVHLAHAVGTDVLCVMGPTDPERHGPYRAPSSSLAQRLSCSFCYKRFDTTKACLLSILPNQVVERTLELLELED